MCVCDFLNSHLGFDRDEKLQLVRFKGRPGVLSPKARFWLFAGWLLPDRFKYVLPVLVLRHRPSEIPIPTWGLISLLLSDEPHLFAMTGLSGVLSMGEEVRYVIDYYGAAPLPYVSPVFSLDVRPALDNFGSLSMRVRAATRSAWENLATEARHSRG